MSFADVLLRVAPRGKDEFERLSVAVDLVQRLGARLNGVFVATNELTDSDHARALFERAVSRTSIETTWRVVDGQSSRALLFQDRRADLSILPLGAAIDKLWASHLSWARPIGLIGDVGVSVSRNAGVVALRDVTVRRRIEETAVAAGRVGAVGGAGDAGNKAFVADDGSPCV